MSNNYVISYHGGDKPSSQEEGMAQRAQWQKWIEDLGEAIVNPGTPLGKTKIVSNDGVEDYTGSNGMSGFSVVKAESMEEALEIAKACPFLLTNGTLSVSQVMKM